MLLLAEVLRLRGLLLGKGHAVDILHEDAQSVGILLHGDILHNVWAVDALAHLVLLAEGLVVTLVSTIFGAQLLDEVQSPVNASLEGLRCGTTYAQRLYLVALLLVEYKI